MSFFLFEEKQLKQLITKKSSESDYQYVKKLYDPESPKSDSLYSLVFRPFDKFLTKYKTVYISPSGLLNKIAYDAVPVNSTELVSDKYNIYYTGSTSQIINKKIFLPKSINKAILFGGIEYDIPVIDMEKYAINFKSRTASSLLTNKDEILISREIKQAKNHTLRSLTDSLNRNLAWSYLPGSLEETKEIEDIFREKKISCTSFTDKFGTEEVFKSLENNAPTVLHVSTHGFYFGNDEHSEEIRAMIDEDVQYSHSDNPLLRSGFILAGGQHAFNGGLIPPGTEDGVLSALEVSQLNLFNTKLVVLSACQTGLGDVKGNEGVYGLKRAFKMAGVEYLLISLWEVPDEQTKELMTNFYKNRLTGIDIRVAFKKAQNHLKTKYAKVRGSAFAWAAFILIN